jgi:hypothetical protein
MISLWLLYQDDELELEEVSPHEDYGLYDFVSETKIPLYQLHELVAQPGTIVFTGQNISASLIRNYFNSSKQFQVGLRGIPLNFSISEDRERIEHEVETLLLGMFR